MEISTQPAFQHITWVIRDFWELPQENEFSLDSPEFLYRGDPYCMRLYRKMKGDKTEFHVWRLSGNSPEREVSCAIGLKKRLPRGDERYFYYPLSLQENESYLRSWIESYRDVYLPENSLTILCTMSRTGSSGQVEEQQGGFLGLIASFSCTRSPAKMELTTQFPCTLVQFKVPDVFELLKETGDSLTSPEFRFAGDTYCLRFEANGDTGDTDLRLVRLASTYTENAVFYRVGYGGSDCPSYSDSSRPLVGNSGFCVSLSTLETERVKYIVRGDLYLLLSLRLGEQSSTGAGTTGAVQKGTGLTDIENLQCHFKRLLEKETVSDACFVDTAEMESGRVVVDDLDKNTFEDILEYLSTGNVEAGLSDNNAFGLYVAADK